MTNKILIINVILCIIPNLIFAQETKNDIPLYNYGSVVIYKSRALYENKEIYNAEKDLEKLKKTEETPECPVNYKYYYNPLSLTGTCFSYEYGGFGSIACGPPCNFLQVKVIELKTLEPVHLSDLVTEKSLIFALKNDNWVREIDTVYGQYVDWHKNYPQKYKTYLSNLDECKTISEILILIDKRKDSIYKNYILNILNSFAFVEYNKKRKLIAVRLVIPEYMGFNHCKHLQLGLWVKPNKKLKKMLMKKLFKKKSNFYIDKFDNGLFIKRHPIN